MVTYTVLGTDGTAVQRQAKQVSLEVAQREIGGYVEAVTLRDTVLLCDEEGLLKGLEYNQLASEMTGQYIVGTALVVPRNKGWG